MGDLVAVIEQATGIDVAVLGVDPDEHGLTMRDPGRNAVFIGVARTRNPMRQRSTLAHELGHVLFEDWTDNDASNWSDRTHEEIRADAFARHLLAPEHGLREFLGSRELLAQADLSAIVQRFLVSPAVAAIALQQAGYIDAAIKQEWMGLSTPLLAVRFGWSDQYHALQADSDQRRAPQQLLARAIKGYAEGVLPAQALATLRGRLVVLRARVVAGHDEGGGTPRHPDRAVLLGRPSGSAFRADEVLRLAHLTGVAATILADTA
jgi:Zn-dependent peptidase ImmA (M78 family)